jgi:iron complex transport system substrate-binding protein
VKAKTGEWWRDLGLGLGLGLVMLLSVVGALAGCDGSARQVADGPLRIVSLVPSVTETLFALGAGADVVGVSQYCDYPAEAAKLPKVGDFIAPNLEAIVALRPTLVIGIATASDQRQVQALKALGIPELMVNDDSVEQVEANIATIGDRIGRRAEAARLLETIKAQIAAVETKLSGTKRLSVLMVVGHDPLVAVGSGTYLDELLTLGGGENIGEASGQTWPRLSLEYLMAVGPQVILDGQMGSERSVPSTFWARYPSIPAVREDRVRGYPIDLMLHPGPRIASALDVIARLIHPEAFGEGRRGIESKEARDDQMMGRTSGRASQLERTGVEERM